MSCSSLLPLTRPPADLLRQGVEDPGGLADVEIGQNPGDDELRQGEEVGQVDVADDLSPHHVREQAVAQREGEVVGEKEDWRGGHEAPARSDQLFELCGLREALPM